MTEHDVTPENAPFTIEQFYEFIKQRKLMGAKCNKCGAQHVPPRPICSNCLSEDLSWKQLATRGKLATFTVIYIAPQQFAYLAPYAYGIVELENGTHLPGMVREMDPEKLKVGTELEVDFDTEASADWPGWPRYYFRPP